MAVGVPVRCGRPSIPGRTRPPGSLAKSARRAVRQGSGPADVRSAYGAPVNGRAADTATRRRDDGADHAGSVRYRLGGCLRASLREVMAGGPHGFLWIAPRPPIGTPCPVEHFCAYRGMRPDITLQLCTGRCTRTARRPCRGGTVAPRISERWRAKGQRSRKGLVPLPGPGRRRGLRRRGALSTGQTPWGSNSSTLAAAVLDEHTAVRGPGTGWDLLSVLNGLGATPARACGR